MDGDTTGPFGDDLNDFTHLKKTKINLLVRWMDDDETRFKQSDDIEFSAHDNLFELLIRRLKFGTWERLTVWRRGGANGGYDIQSNLYMHHGKFAFDADPAGYFQGAKEAVDHVQEFLEQHPSAARCHFILDELLPYQISPFVQASAPADAIMSEQAQELHAHFVSMRACLEAL